MTKRIPYGKQSITRNDIRAVIEVLKSDFLTQGPAVPRFEQAAARYCHSKYAVAFSSGTAALHGACFAAGIDKNSEVITTPLTFAATSNCILYCGGKPVFADIQDSVPLINPDEMRKRISRKTRAIIVVDYSGMPSDYNDIKQFAEEHNLVLIADAAHSLGATYNGKKVGTLADMTVFSFHPVKLITTGEGGMVVTDNKKLYQRLLLFRTHGITKDVQLLQKRNQGPWYYEMQLLGFNYRLTDLQAALGLSQMTKLPIFLKKRNKIAYKYEDAFVDFHLAETVKVPKDRTSAWHLFPLLLNLKKLTVSKKKIVAELHRHNIFVQVHYIPTHLHPYYQQMGFRAGDYPNSELFYDREISLPLYPTLSDQDFRRVVTTVKSVLNKFAKG